MKPKASACIHHPNSNITTILTIDEKYLIVLAYKPFMELVKNKAYCVADIQSMRVQKVYPNNVGWKCQVFAVLGMLCLPLIQMPQLWIALTLLSWILIGRKALGAVEWGLLLDVMNLEDPRGKRSSMSYQIVFSPIKEDIESAKQAISSSISKA
jgi:hypothetical protein